ncbi:MAG: amino acid ABC transporter permease [Lactobacillales bacterium]|jgi:L-cystine transport system permease protein|nr:amino acid ABC transporter permease [Lactobacillales bacterium]
MDIAYIIQTFFLTLRGVPVTLLITGVALVFATPVAFFWALARVYKVPFFSQLAALYTSIIRATPLILLILVFYSAIPSSLNQLFKSLGSSIDVFKFNPLIYACLVFVLTTVGSLSEVFRSAIQTVNVGQLEAAWSSGLTTPQAYRRIIIPQALVSALPNICNLTIAIVKGTSLVFVMTVKDITAIAKVEAAYGYHYTESYLVIFIIYILLCSVIQFAFTRLEDKFQISSKAAPKKVENIRLEEREHVKSNKLTQEIS